ncbi:MAG: hypothetical protein JSR58_06910 [Verrucomicrobia bacterium]|nr:hypothetical protein [Verrucomicrobiota bacterium]
MKKFNTNVLSLPPYLSTAWKNVVSLQVISKPWGAVLVVELPSGPVEVPHLDRETIEGIFQAHSEYLQQETKPALPFSFPGFEQMTSVIQHNPEQSDSPDLPPELLEKIASTVNLIGVSDTGSLPKAEPHCNCNYCQITRAIHARVEDKEVEEDISEEDLRFKTWDIQQKADKLYEVVNPLDKKESYNVFLGDPVGCTCGNKNCEHIQAVLRS